jgi:hypothetical protein
MPQVVFEPLSPGDKVVHQDFFSVALREDGVVWLKRNGVPYPSPADVHRAYDQFLSLVDDWILGRRIRAGTIGTRTAVPMAWLYDVRDAPEMRNDPEFERIVKDRRPDLLKRSPYLAVLVKTAAGRMQVSRLAAKETTITVYSDFDQALAALRQHLPLRLSI